MKLNLDELKMDKRCRAIACQVADSLIHLR